MDSREVLPSLRPLRNIIHGRPVLAVFEVCLRCNSACGYCNLPLNEGRYEMSRGEIRRIFTELHRNGLRFVFLQGGEPLLRKDLPEIVEDLVDIGLQPTLITNGTRFTPTLVERLAQRRLKISVSLDTLNRARYKQIRGADQLRVVMRGIGLLAGFPHPKYLTCIVSDVNRGDALDVVRFAREHGFIPVVGAYHWEIERYGKVDRRLQHTKETAAKVFEDILASGELPRGYFRRYVRDTVDWLRGAKLEPCDAGRYSIAIDASGNVAPCLALEYAGNLRASGLSDIMERFDRAAIHRCSEHSSCNMLCSRVVGSMLRHPLSAMMTPARG